MNTVANQAQNVGQGVVDTGISLFQRLYDNPFVHGLISLLIAIFLSIVLIIISRIIATIIKNRITKSFVAIHGENFKKMGVLIGDIVFYAMAFLSVYISFSVVGIDIGLLMWGITIWVGFAFRQTLSNMISGMVIFSTEEYKIGNIVELSMDWLQYGIIEEVNMKNVILRWFDMRKVVIPNANFLQKAIRAYSPEEDFLRLTVDAFVDVHMDMNAYIQQALLQMSSYDFIPKKEYNQVLIDTFDEKKVKIKVAFFYNPRMGYTAEVLKSFVQVNLLDLWKKIMKEASAPKEIKKEVLKDPEVLKTGELENKK